MIQMGGRRQFGWGGRVWFVALAALALLVPALVAFGHSGEESYVYLDLYDHSVEGRVEYPVGDIGEILGIEIPQDEAGAAAVVEANLDLLQGYAGDHLDLGDSTMDWSLDFDTYEILPTAFGTYVVLHFDVADEFPEGPPRNFTVTYDGVLESKPERSALLIIGTDWGSGTFNNEASSLLTFTPETTTQEIQLDDPSFFAGFSGVVGLGVEHIEIGSDHILFIFALVLPAVLIFTTKKGWEPATSFGSSLWTVLKIATAFTIAHTITLTLGGLGIVEISPRIVEPLIAISIVLAALHNIRPKFFNKEWMIAFGFGLVHGFGFASLLSGLGLDRANRAVSLLGFNLGIELGQVAIIIMVFPLLFLLRRTRAYLTLMKIGSWALAIIASMWFIDRVFSIDLGADRVVGPILAWPRSFWIVLALTAVAGGYFLFERSRGRLLPVAESSRPVAEEPSRVSTP